LIHKAFKILEALSNRNFKNTTIRDISEETGITHSAVHRILQSLAKEDIVTYIPGQGYILTPKLLTLGLKTVMQKGLFEIAIPVMRGLVNLSQETVSLNVPSGSERICLYRVEGSYPISRLIKIGEKGPLFRGAVGKVIAAGFSQREVESLIELYISKGLIKEADASGIIAETESVREKGFAISIGERIENSASIAVPIKDMAGVTQGTLSISTLADRIELEEDRQRYVELLVDAVKQIDYRF